MQKADIDEKKNYEKACLKFNTLFCIEKLTDKEENKSTINNFDGGDKGRGIVTYLKERAWNEMSSGDSCYYLIKDKQTREIAAFFSLKCGLLYEHESYEELNPDDAEFVDLLVDALIKEDQSTLTSYKASELYTDERFLELYNDAKKRIEDSENRKRTGTINVKNTYSAVEIQNFCKNYLYSRRNETPPIGVLVFWIAIVQKMLEIRKTAGCKYAYLFAADHDLISHGDEYRLISYYRTNLHFKNIENSSLAVIRPRYDKSCYEMFAQLSDLEKDQHAIWDTYADILNNED